MNKPRVLVTAPIHSIAVDLLKNVVDVYVANPPLVREEDISKVVEELDPVAIIAVRGAEHIGRVVFDKGPSLIVIARNGVGYDRIDVNTATERGIWVTMTPVKELFHAVAEHAISLMMCLARKICIADRHVRRGGWLYDSLRGLSLVDKIVGIIGLGRIGSEIARRARALGMRVLYYSKSRKPELEERLGIEYAGLEALLSLSDFVVIAVPLTEETENMIGEGELKTMKDSAYLINVSRGAVVDRNALIKALRERWIAGAALDVFHIEPLPRDDPLLELENVILTPHIAWFTEEAEVAMAKTAAEEVLRAIRCEEPLYPVNPRVSGRARSRCIEIIKRITFS